MKYRFIIITMSFLILLSCATTASRYKSDSVYKIFKNTGKAVLDFRIKRDAKGNEWGELRSPFIDAAVIKGNVVEDATGDIHFKFQSLKYLVNWPNGWTEGESELTGELLFVKEENAFRLKIIENYEIWELLKGEIRYMDEYFRDDREGRKHVKDRVERVNLVVDFLKQKEFPEFFWHSKRNTINGESFKKQTQPFLFPETLDIDDLIEKNKLSGYTIDKNLTDDIIFNNGIFWRKSYTKKAFPENLWDLRDTGSLWRDYEEALDLFFVFYNMDYFFNSVLDGMVLKQQG